MPAKLFLLLALVGGALLISGCTQSPTPAGGAAAAASTPAPAVGGATPSVTTTQGSPEQFAAAITNCVPGTPWSYGGSLGATAGNYQVTYTVSGNTPFKGSEFCKVTGAYTTAAAGGQSFTGTVDFYFRGFKLASAASEPTFDEAWVVTNFGGQSMEQQVWANGKQVKIG